MIRSRVLNNKSCRFWQGLIKKFKMGKMFSAAMHDTEPGVL